MECSRFRGLALVVVAAALTACGERGRLIFEPDTDGQGPDTMIDTPNEATALVPAGPAFTVAGRSVDTDGVDSVYFRLINGSEEFPPYVANEFMDTVRFSLPVTTAGRSGDTILVLVFATDLLGVRGDTSMRRLLVQ